MDFDNNQRIQCFMNNNTAYIYCKYHIETLKNKCFFSGPLVFRILSQLKIKYNNQNEFRTSKHNFGPLMPFE